MPIEIPRIPPIECKQIDPENVTHALSNLAIVFEGTDLIHDSVPYNQ